MRLRSGKRPQGRVSLALKCASVFCLLLVSVLVVACGANNNTPVTTSPQAQVTIDLNKNFASPTPPLQAYSCGAWATESTPAYYTGATVMVYAKFVQNVDGNPQGMNNANANAIIRWPDGTVARQNKTTTSDGLAVFQIDLQPSAVGHVTLVEVDFTSADGAHTCPVANDQQAFFTAIITSPTPTATPTNPGGFPFPTPPGFPTFPVPTKTPHG